MSKLREELLHLLSITAPSGREQPVAAYLLERLQGKMDELSIDGYGNVVAERRFGTGGGPTILLSAHMDTVSVDPLRSVLQEGDIWRSTSGPLGADDRAGIAIILHTVDQLAAAGYGGTVKLAFTREEEIGCIGSREIDEIWLGDVDLAVVVDRRGSRDIVTHNRSMAFCGAEVAEWFEQIGVACGMPDWRAVQGGVSDAVTYAMHGIPSVNLSAGYCHEHTEEEYVNVRHAEDTSRFIIQAMVHYAKKRMNIKRRRAAWRTGFGGRSGRMRS